MAKFGTVTALRDLLDALDYEDNEFNRADMIELVFRMVDEFPALADEARAYGLPV